MRLPIPTRQPLHRTADRGPTSPCFWNCVGDGRARDTRISAPDSKDILRSLIRIVVVRSARVQPCNYCNGLSLVQTAARTVEWAKLAGNPVQHLFGTSYWCRLGRKWSEGWDDGLCGA